MPTSDSVVFFTYTLKDKKGHLIDARKDTPSYIVPGHTKKLFTPIQKAVASLQTGAKLTIALLPKDAYGEFDDNLVIQVPKAKFQKPAEIGSRFKVRIGSDKSVAMTVVDQKTDSYILDGNHPLAGMELVCELEVTERRPATKEELKTGKVQFTN